MPSWVKDDIDAWTTAAGITEGTVFRAISNVGRVWGTDTAKVLWDVVRAAAAAAGIANLAHDLRRTCTRLCHLAGGELDQIQFLFGADRDTSSPPLRPSLTRSYLRRRLPEP
jgi:hypothetical protein